MKKGDKFYAIGEYFEAGAEYRKAYMRTKPKDRAKRGERAYKAADCYRRINYTSRAMGSYQNAVRYNYPDSIVFFYLAEMQRKNGDYKKAAQNYELYLQYKPDDVLAQNGLQGCQLAPIWKKHSTRYSVKKEPLLNGRRSDYCPMLTGDDMDILYLTSTRPQASGNELSGITGVKPGDFFVTRKDDKGKWLAPEWVESEINSEYDEGRAPSHRTGRPCTSPAVRTTRNTRATRKSTPPRGRTPAGARPNRWKSPKTRFLPSHTPPFRRTGNGFISFQTCREAWADWTSGACSWTNTGWARWTTWASPSTRRATRCSPRSAPTGSFTSPPTATWAWADWTYSRPSRTARANGAWKT